MQFFLRIINKFFTIIVDVLFYFFKNYILFSFNIFMFYCFLILFFIFLFDFFFIKEEFYISIALLFFLFGVGDFFFSFFNSYLEKSIIEIRTILLSSLLENRNDLIWLRSFYLEELFVYYFFNNFLYLLLKNRLHYLKNFFKKNFNFFILMRIYVLKYLNVYLRNFFKVKLEGIIPYFFFKYYFNFFRNFNDILRINNSIFYCNNFVDLFVLKNSGFSSFFFNFVLKLKMDK